jgi:hypothetical protein
VGALCGNSVYIKEVIEYQRQLRGHRSAKNNNVNREFADDNVTREIKRRRAEECQRQKPLFLSPVETSAIVLSASTAMRHNGTAWAEAGGALSAVIHSAGKGHLSYIRVKIC